MTVTNGDLDAFAEMNEDLARAASRSVDFEAVKRDVEVVAEKLKRVPKQSRSIGFLEQAFEAAGSIVSAGSIDDLTMSSLAELLDVPRATIYQYFENRDALLLAMAMRDMTRMDEQVTDDLLTMPRWDVDSFVRTAIGAFLKIQMESPAFVEIYLRGRGTQLIKDYGRVHNAEVAMLLHTLILDEGLVREDTPLAVAELALEIGDRSLQMAFEHSDEPDMAMVENGISMISAYLRTFATPRGLEGFDRAV